MRKLYFFHYSVIVFVLGLKSISCLGQTSSTDHFRSANSGTWDLANTWESSPDGINNWIPAASVPTSDANTITIRGGHNVTISSSITADQVAVTNGGILELATGSSSVLTVHNGLGRDIIVQNGGIFKQTGTSLPAFSESATLEVQVGGILEAANNNVNASNYANTASTDVASHVLWAEGAIFNWNNTTNPAEGVVYFPETSAIPIFRFSQAVKIGGTTVINGILDANATVSFEGIGPKTFRNGIIGTGKVGVTAITGGQFIISGSTAILGGSGILDLNSSGLAISSGTTVTLITNKVINNYNNGTTKSTGTITNAGTLIAGDYVISGNSKIQIEGTVKTTNVNGLSGATNTTFASGFTVNAPGTYSVIEYTRLGDQIVTTPLTYNNLIISGSGTKTAGAGADVSVSGIFNVMARNTFALNSTNNLKLNTGGILNINADAVFDNGGESQVSGGGSPTINIFGTFITRDVQGFSGTGTSIPGATSTTPTITLNISDGSTIEYGKDGNQTVSSRDDYKNLTFSGSGIKTIPKCRPIGTVTIKDNAIADASNKTFGDTTATNLTMTGGRFIVGGTGTKPDIGGTYNLKGGVIEFTNSGKTEQTIHSRANINYKNIEISGSNVGSSNGVIHLADGGSFTVKAGGSFDNSFRRIQGTTTGIQTFTMEAGATFKTGVTGGFTGNDSAALKNIKNIVIDPKSSLTYNGKNQTITPGAAYPSLLLTGSGVKTVASGMVAISPAADSVVIDTSVVFKVGPGAKADFKNLPVFVRSSAGGTGMIGEIADGPLGLLNATKVTVERFIPARRSFRFLSPSVTTSTSIKENWMEGEVNPTTAPTKDPKPGYGTHITGSNPSANGFDPTITNNPSLFIFNTSTQKWESVPNTRGVLKAGDAYRLMVRGDRSIDMRTPDNYPIPTNTILRAKAGALFTGTFSPALSTVNNGYTFIGNPYASSVDFLKMSANSKGISSSYYVWDPHLNVRGAYVAYNAVYDSTNNKSSKVDRNIQPGQAFFVQTTGSSPSIQFREDFKSTAVTTVLRTPFQKTKLSVQLLLNLNEGMENSADGVTAFFDENFSNDIGNDDSYKFTNPDENLAINHKGISLSMEGRAWVTSDDTIALNMWQFRQQSYYLRLAGTNFSPDVTALVKDNYLHKETPFDLSSVTLLPFSIDTTVPNSFAKDRFSIVFKAGSTLPVTLTNVNAYQKDQGIQVDWTAEAEINIDRYEVERSSDGQTFDKATGITAKGNNAVTQNYSWFDENANTGSNFYRIKVIEKSGGVKYSNVVKVNIAEGNGSITLFPNPIKGNVIQVQLSNMEKGRYSAILYNNLGQQLYSGIIEHTATSGTYRILPGRLIKGTYTLQIIKGDTTMAERVIVE